MVYRSGPYYRIIWRPSCFRYSGLCHRSLNTNFDVSYTRISLRKCRRYYSVTGMTIYCDNPTWTHTMVYTIYANIGNRCIGSTKYTTTTTTVFMNETRPRAITTIIRCNRFPSTRIETRFFF